MAASMCKFRRANVLKKILWREARDRVAYVSSDNGNIENKLFTEIEDESLPKVEDKPAQNFASLFRQSMFAQMGDFKNKRVTGVIQTVKGDDLYIDFGGKFNCVCPRPKVNARSYKKGTEVRLVLHDVEMTSSFLGSDKHITLLEADCTLLGKKTVKVRKIKPGKVVEEEEDFFEYVMPDPAMIEKLDKERTDEGDPTESSEGFSSYNVTKTDTPSSS